MTIFKRKMSPKVFQDFEKPIRSEVHGHAHLEKIMQSMAQKHVISPRATERTRGKNLAKKLAENEAVLIESFRLIVEAARAERSITPAAEWFIDNFYIVEEQIKDIRDHFPREYYLELPSLKEGELTGFPRIYAVAWEFIAHTDSLFDQELLKSVIRSYQKIQPITMGELWAVPITLRLVMIENLRRLAAFIVSSQIARVEADAIVDEILGLGGVEKIPNESIIKILNEVSWSNIFAVQLIQRLRFQEEGASFAVEWLDQQLKMRNIEADKIVQDIHSCHSSANVTVKNIITGMRAISALDWRDFFEEVSLVNEKLNEYPLFRKMDFMTRDKYRHSIEELSRGSHLSELEVATAAIDQVKKNVDVASDDKRKDLGFYLISHGRYELEKEIHFKVKIKNLLVRWYIQHREFFYLGGILSLTLFFCWSALKKGERTGLDWVLFCLGILPASELAVALINRMTVHFLPPRHFPRLDFSKKIPTDCKTFVVVPTMLTKLPELSNQISQLETYYLANRDDSVYFALLSDWQDAEAEELPTDRALLEAAQEQVQHLNEKYGPNERGGKVFFLFHRLRKWNESEGKWMGYERKRGKLQEFNQLLRGAKDTTFLATDGKLEVPEGVVYVITLDNDTKLPKNAVANLVGTLAHPLNRAKFDDHANRVVEGYGILQPRVTPTLPEVLESTTFQRLSSGPCGIDPYAAAVSDVYQDLFGEGSFVGKGIYEVDVFERAMRGRTPENRLLSHDLFEGNFARCGLVSDIEFFEEFPSHFEVAMSRAHRWIRGDWQLLPWILGRGGTSISLVGRWKMIDNLRRSLFYPALFFFIVLLFISGAVGVKSWALLAASSLLVPPLLSFFAGVLSYRPKQSFIMQVKSMGEDLWTGLNLSVLNFIFIPYYSWIHSDAIIRSLTRLLITKRNLLEWTTSAQSKKAVTMRWMDFFRKRMGMEVLLGIVGALIFYVGHRLETPFLFFTVLLLWALAPLVAWKISQPPKEKWTDPLNGDELVLLRDSARKIWHFFATFVNEKENHLPPDNFQEWPSPVVAHRSSPTNFGLYLLSVVSARDFGWIGLVEMTERLELTLMSMQELPKFNGHFYNWYETTTRHALEPRYISSVDNGNLAGHLLALAQACEEMANEKNLESKALSGIKDALRFLEEACMKREHSALVAECFHQLRDLLTKPYEKILAKDLFWKEVNATLKKFLHKAQDLKDVYHWGLVVEREVKGHQRDFYGDKVKLRKKLLELAETAREMFYEMDFSFLYDPDRKLFSIGYRLQDSALDGSYYDLLASEARLLSYVAVAKGDVPVEHWFHLGRSLASIEKGTALISWSGSMFEYLMPSLVMRTLPSSLLDQTCKLIVKKQMTYGQKKSIPWGMSESAYSSQDQNFTYQYSNFGVPDLAFKRGLGKEIVVAPYATMLAGMYDAKSAVKNLKRFSKMKAVGEFGYYESIDFTKARLAEKESFTIVKTYMAHHQGMGLVSISNILHDNLMVKRFHHEPIVQSCELLLQERTPRFATVAKTREESVKVEYVSMGGESAFRAYHTANHKVPRTHLLSNGHYSVMVTAAGSGYSHFNNVSVTRWREDVTCDNWGSYIFFRDIYSNNVWSAGYQPTVVEPDKYEVVFTEDRAKIEREDYAINSQLEIFVSPEDNVEIRRQHLTNNGREVRVIEVTSYAEIVLNTKGADIAHPAFSNLFVQTEYLPEITSLIAHRRPRSSKEESLWMAYVLSVDSNAIGQIEFETDRALFIGRGEGLDDPFSIHRKLSNSVGGVLDPIVSFRSRVRIEPGSTAGLTYSMIVGKSREEVVGLAEKFHQTQAHHRASSMAWTEAQIKLHYLGIDHSEANLFQQLANRILYLDSTLRSSREILKKNEGNATHLWRHGISGDHPIVLIKIDDSGQRSIIRQLLRAHEYWGLKCLVVDLVILNEKMNSYSQELQNEIEAMIAHRSPTFSQGKVFLLRADLLPESDRHLLHASARAILVGREGNVAEQVKRMVRKIEKRDDHSEIKTSPLQEGEQVFKLPPLDFFNGLGGFTKTGDYVIHLKEDLSTPAPWINVVANPRFGFHVSERGAGSTWSVNSRENQLTPWSNDPVRDPVGECFYLYDPELRELWSPTKAPIRIPGGEYVVTYGQGYARFETKHVQIKSTLTQFVHPHKSVKISKLVLANESSSPRTLIISAYLEWVLGSSRAGNSSYIITGYEKSDELFTAYNPWNQEFGRRYAFATFVGGNTSWTGDRAEFIGRNGHLKRPCGAFAEEPLSGMVGAGLDPCGAIRKTLALSAKSETTLIFILGQGENLSEARALSRTVTQENVDVLFDEVALHWDDILGKIQVETPDLAMNLMLNKWLLYQTMACRLWARSAFYQSGGAFGFRDQLQDSMAVFWCRPQMVREQILRSAARQFLEGDVQHWWHMPTGRGVRTHFSDDLLWLPYVVAYYLKRSGDVDILNEEVPFLKGPKLLREEEDAYYTPEVAEETGTLYEHCARAIERSLAVGEHGLPLMGGGDWNDGMNRVGHLGKGESVWLAWFLMAILDEFAVIANLRGETTRSEAWSAHRTALKQAVEANAWDGEWYRRAYYDDGGPLGSIQNAECMIDSLAQTWAVISKAGARERAMKAMESVEKNLIKKEDQMILLFTPPFDKFSLGDPGYIKGYLPGVRENGGQYTHAAIWCILAYAELGDGKKALDLFSLINPIHHSSSFSKAHLYKVEPFVVAADVYSAPLHLGRGGWTWYTGSSGWMYSVGIETLLGFKVRGDKFTIDPKISPDWPSYKMTYRYLSTTYKIEIKNPRGQSTGAIKSSFKEAHIEGGQLWFHLKDVGGEQHIELEMG